MADDTPTAAPTDLTPDQATATLAQMRLDAHPPAPISPTTPAEARARLNALTSNKEWGARLLAGRIEEGRGNLRGSVNLQTRPTQLQARSTTRRRNRI